MLGSRAVYKVFANRPIKNFTLLHYYMQFSITERRNCFIFHQHLNKDLFIKVSQENVRFHSSLQSDKSSILTKIKKTALSSLGEKTRINRGGCLSYEKCADTVNYEEFIKFFNLPDTFQSWFLSIQLHVWMVILVTISQKNGRIFRNSVVDSMWYDVEMRMKQLTELKSAQRKQNLNTLVYQFQAALISYDEGILGDDMILAAAAWRTLFSFAIVDPQVLENIVIYIHKQLAHLECINTESILYRGNVTFQPLNTVFLNNVNM